MGVIPTVGSWIARISATGTTLRSFSDIRMAVTEGCCWNRTCLILLSTFQYETKRLHGEGVPRGHRRAIKKGSFIAQKIVPLCAALRVLEDGSNCEW
jgi:hypothetical protein